MSVQESFGGIFDFDAKQTRLADVSGDVETPE